jgi:RNA polymerase sigma-70 factor (ECF subfamily)
VTDLDLARRMAVGDEAAFAAFFEAYFPSVFRFALARLDRDEDAAEEVAQAALARGALKIDRYRGEASLFTWLCTLCRHEVSAWWERNRGRARRVELVEEAPEVRAALESLGGPPPGPEESLRRSELARRVQLVLDALPGRYGDALEWKYIQGLSVREIAQRLGTGAKAAESLLSRAREAFRDGFSALALENGGNG